MKKIISSFICIALVFAMLTVPACADSTVANRIHFIPTTITVTDSSVTVAGYFVNLNENVDVMNFKKFTMRVYVDGDEILYGDFGTINEFTVKAMRTKYQSFTFTGGNHGLNRGTYDCSDSYTATFGCNFSSYTHSST